MREGFRISYDIYKTTKQIEFKLLQRGRKQTDYRYCETYSIKKRDYESFLKTRYCSVN